MTHAEITLTEWLDKVGRGKFQGDLGYSTQIVGRALNEGVMPSHWYRDTNEWSLDNFGEPAPIHLFKWSHAQRKDDKQNVHEASKFQGAAE